MALRWLFYRDTVGQCRWEVRGAEGPIATSGNIFECIDDCIADARARGFSGPAEPDVVNEAFARPEIRMPRQASR